MLKLYIKLPRFSEIHSEKNSSIISSQGLEAVLTLPGYVLRFLTALYFHISIRIFCNLFICLVIDGLLQSICFGMLCSKHSLTFDTYLFSCRFHCIDIFYINFRSWETFTIANSGAILFLIETLSNFRTMKCWFVLYLQMYVLG